MDKVSSYPLLDFGIRRLDHVVSSVPKIAPVVSYLKKFTRFHEFAEFTDEDVGTCENGLNSVVLANNEEIVLLPLIEPMFGTKRKSQIYKGVGLVHHSALESEDIHIQNIEGDEEAEWGTRSQGLSSRGRSWCRRRIIRI